MDRNWNPNWNWNWNWNWKSQNEAKGGVSGPVPTLFLVRITIGERAWEWAQHERKPALAPV